MREQNPTKKKEIWDLHQSRTGRVDRDGIKSAKAAPGNDLEGDLCKV